MFILQPLVQIFHISRPSLRPQSEATAWFVLHKVFEVTIYRFMS